MIFLSKISRRSEDENCNEMNGGRPHSTAKVESAIVSLSGNVHVPRFERKHLEGTLPLVQVLSFEGTESPARYCAFFATPRDKTQTHFAHTKCFCPRVKSSLSRPLLLPR